MRKAITNIHYYVTDSVVHLTWLMNHSIFESQQSNCSFEQFEIYRKEVDFVFGVDYDEFFYNLDFNKAELVFSGRIEPENKRKFSFVDKNAEIGKTYGYYIKSKNGDISGPLPLKIRDGHVWWSYEKIMSSLNELKRSYPEDTELFSCGQTIEGRDIPVLIAGKGDITIGLTGIVHGGESGPELIIPFMKHLLADGRNLLNKFRIIAVPAVNIDAREKMVSGTPWYIRTNSRGVDLNRNFPCEWENIDLSYGENSSDPTATTYRGSCPASEPETQALIALFKKYPPDLLFSYHWLAGICSLPALVSVLAKDNSKYIEKAEKIIKTYAQRLGIKSNNNKYIKISPTTGTFGRWLYKNFGTIAFDLEGGIGEESQKSMYDLADRKMIENFQKKHVKSIIEVIKQY
jgi:hypothetical protein